LSGNRCEGLREFALQRLFLWRNDIYFGQWRDKQTARETIVCRLVAGNFEDETDSVQNMFYRMTVACVQTSPISFHPRKRDVCETASLIVFQYPAVFQESVESAFIGCLTIATVRNNSDWLSSGNARDNVCDLHLAGFSIDKNMSDCVLCFSTILKSNDRNLVKSCSEFKVQEGILSLQFIVHETSPYICRSCVGKLRKRRGLYAKVRKIEDELFSEAFKAGLAVKKRSRH